MYRKIAKSESIMIDLTGEEEEEREEDSMEEEGKIIRDGLQLYGSKRDGEVEWWEEEEGEGGRKSGKGGVWLNNDRNVYMVYIEEREIDGESE